MPIAEAAFGEKAGLVTMPTSAAAASFYLAARADALHNFLARVTTLCETQMRCFERRFVRNHRVVEIIREPRDAGFESQRVERAHADGRAVRGGNSGGHAFPEHPEMLARSDDFSPGAAEVRKPNQMRGHPVDGKFRICKFRKAFERQSARLCHDRARLWTFHRTTAGLV